MDAALAFGGRHALHAMHTGFVLKPSKDVSTGYFGDAFFETAQFGGVVVHHLKAPAAQAGVFLVHGEQFGREQPGLIAAGGWPDFQDGRAGVGFVLR